MLKGLKHINLQELKEKIKYFIENLIPQTKIFINKWKKLETWKECLLPENPSEHKRLVRFLFFTLGTVLSIIIIIFIISFSIVKIGHPLVRIPNVENNDIVDAVRIMNSAKFTTSFEMRFCENVEPYKIIKQYPSARVLSRQGRIVTLVVSLGKDVYKVPALCGLTKEEALKILDSSQIPYIIQTVKSENDMLDKVIAQSVSPNETMERSTPLIVTIADSLKKNQYRLDNFIRQPLEFAVTTLYNNQIKPFIITTNVDSISDDGLILEQNIPEGQILAKHASIILTVGLYAYDEGEKQNMRWHVFNYYIPRIKTEEGEDPELNTLVEGEISVEDLEMQEAFRNNSDPVTAKLYRAVLEDNLGRTRTIYERVGAEGTELIRVFKSYGKATVTIYADNEIIGVRHYDK